MLTIRTHDFLYGVVPPSSHHAAEDRLTPAQRLRYIHMLITSPFQAGQASSTTSYRHGAGVRPRCKAFPNVVDMTPLHDPTFEKRWVSTWSKMSLRSMMYGISDDDIDELREHLGENIAMYFAFLNCYFMALAPAAMLGLVFWASGRSYDPTYAAVLLVWATAFLEVWRIRERKLAVRWGMSGVSHVAARNESFSPRKIVRASVTGEPEEVFEWWRRDLRYMVTLPITLAFVALLVLTITALFVFEVILKEVYDGPFQSVVPLIPTVLFGVGMPLILSVWRSMAGFLTWFENYETENAFVASLTAKIFGMQSLVTFAGLTFSAYIYIPFGERIVAEFIQRGYLAQVIQMFSLDNYVKMPKDVHFSITPGRLHAQLFALIVTGQLSNTFSELVLPILLRTGGPLWARLRKRLGWAPPPPPKGYAAVSSETERALLERVHDEMALPEYDLFTDYAEMATQFSTITMWSVIWPLAPVMGFVNNFFELRSDAMKLVMNMRRPVPRRSESIERWMDVLALSVRLAVFTNVSLIYLFENKAKLNILSGHSVMRTYLHPHLNATHPVKQSAAHVMPYFLPRSSSAGAVMASFLCALIWEQVFKLVPMFLHHVFERVLWHKSEEERAVRRKEHENRMSIVERMPDPSSSLAPSLPWQNSTIASAHRTSGVDAAFWDPVHDTGLSVIQNAAKTS